MYKTITHELYDFHTAEHAYEHYFSHAQKMPGLRAALPLKLELGDHVCSSWARYN
jgi:hypothetical protein